MGTFDPYHQWLGIRDVERPPNHYRLLGIDVFETDLTVIANAADRQMAHLRTFHHGPHADDSQRLLNEVAAARVCLLDPEKKSAYDQRLQVSHLGQTAEAPYVPLGRPGRGPRGKRPWLFWASVISPVLLVAVGLFGYHASRQDVANVQHGDLPPAADPSPGTLPGNGVGKQPTVDPAESARDDATDTESVPDNTVTAGPATNVVDPVAESVDEADVDASLPDRDEPPASPPDEPIAPPTVLAETSATDWGQLPEWNAQPPQFSTAEAVGRFLFTLSQRDVLAARSILVALEKNPGAAVGDRTIYDARLVVDALDQFWNAFNSSVVSLEVGQSLNMNGMRAVITSLTGGSIELESPVGTRRSFDLRRTEVEPRVAISLVERRFRLSQPVAWRLSAVFLSIDKQGDERLADEIGRRAELQGVSWDFLVRGIRRLQRLPELPPSDGAAIDALSDSEPKQSIDARVPSRDEQNAARREVLRPELVLLKEQKIPREQVGAELYQKSQQAGLSDAAVYVLLRYARQRATTYRDIDTVWAVVNDLEQKFGADGDALRYQSVEAMSRRKKKGGDRRRLADLAAQLARDAAIQDDYANASRFATLAQTIGRSVGDADYTRSLQQIKQHVLAAKNEYQRLQPALAILKKNPDDAAARADYVRFQVLTKGDFSSVAKLQAAAEPELREQLQREMDLGAEPEQWAELGESWFRFARTRQSIEQVNAYRRAVYWLNRALPQAEREETLRIRRMLDAITEVVGRDSTRLDLTRLSPVRAAVGFGTFGVNENPDRNRGGVSELPNVGGESISRYLWACGPSGIEYVIPAGAKRFSAIAILNATSSDGVVFALRADGEVIFSSPRINAMGTQVPVDVDLPRSTQLLELIVDSGSNNVGDHAYWVAPTLSF